MDIRNISIDELTVGMFVGDVFNKRGVKLLAANSIITHNKQIELLRRQGVENIRINLRKGRDVVRETQKAEVAQPVDTRIDAKYITEYFREMEKAQVIVNTTLGIAKDMMSSIREERQFSAGRIEQASEQIVESILRNPDALTSLCQIRGAEEYDVTHSVNVAILGTVLANSLGYDHDKLIRIGMGGLMQDIGKMQIPERILNNTGKYTAVEYRIMKKHPELGLKIIDKIKSISDLSKIMIIQHHERCNGGGYPFSLKAGEIDEVGHIAAVADVYDALTSDRVYRPAWPPQKALAVIFQGADAEYSRLIVERFTRQIGIYPVGSFVRLSSGEMGVVIKIDQEQLLMPTVCILFDAEGKRYATPVECDLAKKAEAGETLMVDVSLDPRMYGVNISDFISS